MDEESYFKQVARILAGPFTKDPPTTVNLAPPLAHYPTNEDAEFARKSGFTTNNINQDYLDNNKARVLSGPVDVALANKMVASPDVNSTGPSMLYSGADVPMKSITDPRFSPSIDLNSKENTSLHGKLSNTMLKAALAANRSPIAALGFDPSKVVVDAMIQHPNIAGFYQPKQDSIYTALSPEDSITHESTHRGIQKLREQYPTQVKQLTSEMPDEEYLVRWLMHSQGGDPEGGQGPVDAKQRQVGIDMFGRDKYPSIATSNRANLDKLQELAITAMKDRGKRVGPQ